MLKKITAGTFIFLITTSTFAIDNLKNKGYSVEFNNTFDVSETKDKDNRNKENDFKLSFKTLSDIDSNNNIVLKLSYENNYFHTNSHNDDFYVENFYLNSHTKSFNSQFGRVNMITPYVSDAYANGINAFIPYSNDFNLNFSIYDKNSIDSINTKSAFIDIRKKLGPYTLKYYHAKVGNNIKLNAASILIDIKPIKFYTIYAGKKYNNKISAANSPKLVKSELEIRYGYTKTKISYGYRGKDANNVVLDNDSDADANYKLWQLDLMDKRDSSVYGLDFTLKSTPSLDLRAAIAGGDVSNFKNAKEYLAEIKYKYNDKLNFKILGSKYKESDRNIDPVTSIAENFYTTYYKYRLEIDYKF